MSYPVLHVTVSRFPGPNPTGERHQTGKGPDVGIRDLSG